VAKLGFKENYSKKIKFIGCFFKNRVLENYYLRKKNKRRKIETIKTYVNV
jgi:hypothetical protein